MPCLDSKRSNRSRQAWPDNIDGFSLHTRTINQLGSIVEDLAMVACSTAETTANKTGQDIDALRSPHIPSSREGRASTKSQHASRHEHVRGNCWVRLSSGRSMTEHLMPRDNGRQAFGQHALGLQDGDGWPWLLGIGYRPSEYTVYRTTAYGMVVGELTICLIPWNHAGFIEDVLF
jgi:hypothetical protein